jgi:hypothetical protein
MLYCRVDSHYGIVKSMAVARVVPGFTSAILWKLGTVVGGGSG